MSCFDDEQSLYFEQDTHYEVKFNGLDNSYPSSKPFVYDPLYYHMRLKAPVTVVGHQFTTIKYQGKQIDIPNKIIRYKGKKRKLYVHKRIFHEILKRHGMGILPSCGV